MRYRIMKGGEVINVIVASEEFVSKYCAENGYTHEEAPLPELEPVKPDSEAELSVWDELDAAYQEGVNSVD